MISIHKNKFRNAPWIIRLCWKSLEENSYHKRDFMDTCFRDIEMRYHVNQLQKGIWVKRYVRTHPINKHFIIPCVKRYYMMMKLLQQTFSINTNSNHENQYNHDRFTSLKA